MADASQTLNMRQYLDPEDIDQQRQGYNGPHDQSEMPGFGFIAFVIQDDAALDLTSCQVASARHGGLPCEDSDPS